MSDTPTPPRPAFKTPTLLRDQLVAGIGCTHFELGRLLREKIAPLPVRINGVILWYEDEARAATPKCRSAIERWHHRREKTLQPTAVAESPPASTAA